MYILYSISNTTGSNSHIYKSDTTTTIEYNVPTHCSTTK